MAAMSVDSLPKVVKRRLKALKKLQFEMIKIESKFYEEVHELECKYAAQYQPLNERRREILSGGVEPTDSDCDWPSDEEDEDEELSVGGPLRLNGNDCCWWSCGVERSTPGDARCYFMCFRVICRAKQRLRRWTRQAKQPRRRRTKRRREGTPRRMVSVRHSMDCLLQTLQMVKLVFQMRMFVVCLNSG